MASTFNPFKQNVTMHYANGKPFNVPMPQLNSFVQYNVRLCINYGSQLGASGVLLVILLLLTRPEKRSSAVFVINALALFFNFMRLLFQCIHFTTGFEEVYPYFAYDYSAVHASAYAISILGVILETIVVICFEASLVLQVQVVCATLRRRYRQILLGLSILMALVPIGFRLGWMVVNCIYIISLASMMGLIWLESSVNIAITTSICFFCTVFVAKLGYAIKQRQRLGVREFGPMKVIFVMGCQTLTVPALFAILQYAIVVPELSSNVLTLVTISLPLSSIWAGATLDHSRRTSSTPDNRPRNLWHALAAGAASTLRSKPMTSDMSASTAAQTLCYSEQPVSKMQDPNANYGIGIEHEISIDSVSRRGDSDV